MIGGLFRIIAGFIIAGILSPKVSFAEETGVIMDVAGKVEILRGENTIYADFGMNLQDGDEVAPETDASITLVTYVDCREWVVNGPQRATLSGATVVAITGQKIKAQRQLPVCYSPSATKSGKSGVIGGLVLRGAPKDPVKELRDEFVAGSASNATLMTLIMNDLKNGKKETAKAYFKELYKRVPESQFVKGLVGELEEKK